MRRFFLPKRICHQEWESESLTTCIINQSIPRTDPSSKEEQAFLTGAAPHGFTQGIFHILNRIYNCTKPGNWCVNHHAEKNLCTSYCTHYLFQLHILILQLHKLLSTAH